MNPIDFSILSIGAWGANFRNAGDLQTLLMGNELEDDGAKGPKPEIIPANERRRAPLPVRLAIESSWQACQNAKIDASELGCVFVSGLGDTQLTDYMCKVLAGDNKALSPTKFHNSVHNAAAGYWTISTGCMQAANSVAGYAESVSLTLLEGLIQAQAEQRPLLLTFYDAPVSPVLKPLLKNETAFSISMIVAPTQRQADVHNRFRAEVIDQAADWPAMDLASPLSECYQNNPVARALPLAELFFNDAAIETTLPLSAARAIKISAVN